MQTKLFFLVLPLVGAVMAMPVDNDSSVVSAQDQPASIDVAKDAAFNAEDFAADDFEDLETRAAKKPAAKVKKLPHADDHKDLEKKAAKKPAAKAKKQPHNDDFKDLERRAANKPAVKAKKQPHACVVM